METTIPIGELKTHCYNLLDEARKNNNQLIITRRNIPIATITPINVQTQKHSLLGTMQNRATINGDIVDSIETSWNAENE